MDDWNVPDEAGLRLIAGPSVTRAGKRPRFRLTGEQVERFVLLREIDRHLIDLYGKAPAWLARSNPAHYEKIRRILTDILQQPEASVPRWIQANFDGRDVTYAPVVLTSHPPKRRLSFALDATRYEAIIVLTNVRGDIVPLR